MCTFAWALLPGGDSCQRYRRPAYRVGNGLRGNQDGIQNIVRPARSLLSKRYSRLEQSNQRKYRDLDLGASETRSSPALPCCDPRNLYEWLLVYGLKGDMNRTSSDSFPLRRVCIFCGSTFGENGVYREHAAAFARSLAQSGIGIVFGGASVGLMGVVADSALSAGGEVIGVLPRSMMAREIGHTGLTELHLVDTLHERKAMMANLSDAFVALPGGIGTWEEFFEVFSWLQIGLHQKPCALLNSNGFYDALLGFIDQSVVEGFVRPESAELLIVETTPEALRKRLHAYRPVSYDRWQR